jgi:Holliday junction DNA helicase RuvB
MEENTVGSSIEQASPKTLDHIIAQPYLQESLKIYVSAYWNERAVGRISCLPPILLCSPPSGGKTTVAQCIHNELANSKLIETIGESLNRLPELYDICLEADSETTVFVDECQGMGAAPIHIWLKILSEGKLSIPKGTSARKNYTIPVAQGITFIFATTHEYCLSSALRSRLRVFRLEEYTEQGLFEILQQRATSLKWKVGTEECLRYIAQRSKSMPRLALSYLQASYNVCRSESRDWITFDDVKKTFYLSQTDNPLGLDKLDVQYLKTLREESPTKLNILAARIGMPARTLQEVVEPFLLKIGFIKKNADRLITESGREFIDQLSQG